MTEMLKNLNTPTDISACHARDLGIDNLVECLIKNPSCIHAISYGSGHFCEHPDRKEIASRTLPH